MNLQSSNYKFDSSNIVVDSKQWLNYIPFLCDSLGLITYEDINKIKEIKFIDQWNMLEFKIEYESSEIYSISIIKLYYMSEPNTEKLHITFIRVKSEHINNDNFDKSYLTNNLLTILGNKSQI
jgi:hypothetical protein